MKLETKEKIKKKLDLTEEEFIELYAKTSPYVTNKELEYLLKSLVTKDDLQTGLKDFKKELKETFATKDDLQTALKDLKKELKETFTTKDDLQTALKDFRKETDQRFDKIDKKFNWLIGFMFTLFIIIIGVLIAVILK